MAERGKMNRIEEVAQEIYQIVADELAQFIDEFKVSVRKPFKWNKLSGEKKSFWYKRVAQLSQLFPQPLDDKELGDKIAKEMSSYAGYCSENWSEEGRKIWLSRAGLILALLQPKIEEAEKRGIDSGIVAYESTCEGLIQEARRQERERIIKFFELRQGSSEPVLEKVLVFGGKPKTVLCRRFRIEETDWQALFGKGGE